MHYEEDVVNFKIFTENIKKFFGVDLASAVNIALEYMPFNRSLDDDEIAYILNISKYSVRSIAARAMNKIEKELNDVYGFFGESL
ncbi:hypothetical protein NrS5_30 [Nitratiruptor phage NrS-5]|uniref:hypothetical protein n=1 Tax=unclassified Nitratiruptor TaxID=2624044 RepID=UPI001915D0E0|nr:MULTISPECIES: hypothetical protein [unclassified Nitratiruptor]BCD61734.1 hypothetical protein NitYY0813_C0594 [Nitratiruptor sp. YY08-13]BCD65669.1 hypothetical protein NitYY0826_C0596 [Nitratiruptor sp. YY08-26]BCD83212.1 hypothetical protein NrS4_30 [Nitratiruptor phage NrS-4]BCD83271.1 hypothetical protein NrS5_30 [Nitratiruptor phage NrS-5]